MNQAQAVIISLIILLLAVIGLGTLVILLGKKLNKIKIFKVPLVTNTKELKDIYKKVHQLNLSDRIEVIQMLFGAKFNLLLRVDTDCVVFDSINREYDQNDFKDKEQHKIRDYTG